jgi:hypothetical protein
LAGSLSHFQVLVGKFAVDKATLMVLRVKAMPRTEQPLCG